MFKNYLKIAFRNIIRHKAYSAINISGLTIGMASSILILLWVRNELSYDRFHKNADQLYRITVDASGYKAAVNPAGMPAGLQAEIPQIKKTVRLSHLSSNIFESGQNKFEEKKVFYVDPTFLEVFTFPLVKGDPKTALQRIDGVLLTERMAKKYFGDQEALGRTLKKDNDNMVTVTGILADVPANSHLQFDFILPIAANVGNAEDLKTNTWKNFNFYSYVQLDNSFTPSTASLARLNDQIDKIYRQHVPEGIKAKFQLQPLTSIHLHSNLQIDLPGHGNVQYVNIFFIVAIVILIVACINFMNLATARSARRAREVGLRKVVGAMKSQLIWQFLGESLLISFFALLLAVALVWLVLPIFNTLAQKELTLRFVDTRLLLSLLGIALATGLISGSYPALFLSGFQPVKVLKGHLKARGANLLFRNGLVIVQFVVSIVLLIGTVVVYKQLQFIKSRNMGFEKENLLYMPMNSASWEKEQALTSALQQNPLTAEYTLISELPVNLTTGNVDVQWEGKDPQSQIVIPSMDVDEDFFDVFRMKMLNGRTFSTSHNADSNNYVINERAVQVMGMTMENAVGKPILFDDKRGMIIGVVKDFNFKPVQQAIEPLILRLNANKYGGYMVVRTRPGSTEATIKALESISRDLNPAYPFNYNFLDQDLASLYKGEQQMGNIFNLFAILAVFISSLGLYGLSAFLAQQRTKEIGIRKVLGASTFNIVYLLSTGFTRLVLIAIVVAIPIALLAINRWLENFAYHVQLSWLIFVTGPLAALIVAWLTVSYESLKAAITNPVSSLKSE
jgi:predicted permease